MRRLGKIWEVLGRFGRTKEGLGSSEDLGRLGIWEVLGRHGKIWEVGKIWED